MPGRPSRAYWDANLFLYYINNDLDRITVLDSLLREARKANHPSIITSSFSIVEVAHGQQEQNPKTLSDATLAIIDALWEDNTVLTLVDVYPTVAYEARRLHRECISRSIRRVKGGDAVHLATAQIIGVDEFLTYDEALFECQPIVKMPIRKPEAAQLAMGFQPEPNP